MFALVVRFDLRDEEAAVAFDALVAVARPAIQDREPGTLVYAVHEVEGEPLARVFYEVYVDAAAHATHEQTPEVARFLAEKDQYLTGVRLEFLGSPQGKGLPAV